MQLIIVIKSSRMQISKYEESRWRRPCVGANNRWTIRGWYWMDIAARYSSIFSVDQFQFTEIFGMPCLMSLCLYLRRVSSRPTWQGGALFWRWTCNPLGIQDPQIVSFARSTAREWCCNPTWPFFPSRSPSTNTETVQYRASAYTVTVCHNGTYVSVHFCTIALYSIMPQLAYLWYPCPTKNSQCNLNF